MPVAPLTGYALASAIELASAVIDDHEVAFWRSTLRRGDLDETAITPAWLPSGPDWADVSGQVLLSAGATVAHDGTGLTIAFTVADESRTVWADDLAVAVTARHWYPVSGAWGGWYLLAWGFLDGSDRQTQRLGLDQTGQRLASYHGYWAKARVPAMRLGRRNLAAGATIVASTPALLTPAAEAPLEYVSQADCAPQKLIDGNADTCAVADALSDVAQPAIGDTTIPRFLRLYGPFTRGVAAGGEPRLAELYCGHDATPWGTTWVGVPDMYNAGGGEGQPAERDEPGRLHTAIVTQFDGSKVFRVTTRQSYDLARSTWIQWIVPTRVKIPLRASVEVRASDGGSEGRRIHLMLSDATGPHTQRKDVNPLVLGPDWQRHEFVFDSDSQYGGAKLEITTGQGESFAGDFSYDLRNFQVAEGYSDQAQAHDNGERRIFLCYDNGAGVSRCQRIEYDLTGGVEDWRIPAFGSIVICDDIPTFKAKFGDTGKTLMQMKALQPEWYFAPGVGRMKLAWATNPNRNNYDDPSLETIEEINFGPFGWAPWESISRQAPIGWGGSWTREPYPHVGLLPVGGVGDAYWWVDLGAYQAPKLRLPITATSTRIPVDDIDAYTEQGYTAIDGERIWWIGKDGDSMVVGARGIAGTTAADHLAGTAVIPDGFGGTYQNTGTKQTGWNVDQVAVRRKPGTPIIEAGAFLVSNQVAPGNPSEGGALWERHPDWDLLANWSDLPDTVDTITYNVAQHEGGPREFRHLVLRIDKMKHWRGVPQRPKANELLALECRMAAGQQGAWASKDASDLGGALGYLLTRRAGMPPSKVALATRANGSPLPTPAIGDLPIADTAASQALSTVQRQGYLRVWLDAANRATIDAAPESAAYTPTAPYFRVGPEHVLGDIALNWTDAHQVSQVTVTGTEAASMRTFTATYPQVPAGLGLPATVTDVLVRGPGDVGTIAESEWRQRNARRSSPLKLGALPWLEPNQRWVLDIPDIDLGGGGEGVPVVVSKFSIAIGVDDGGVTFESNVEFSEMTL